MFRFSCTVVLVAAFALSGHAQNVGVPGVNDFVINGSGSGALSCTTVNVTGGTTMDLAVTTAPFSIIVGIVGDTCSAGAFPVGSSGYSIDVDIGSMAIVIDGTGKFAGHTPLTPFLVSNALGDFNLVVTTGETPGTCFGAQMAALNPSFPFSIVLTQAHNLCIGAETLCPAAVGLDLSPLSNDGFVNVVLSAPFSFYGTSYSDLYVNMNGSITFGSGDGDATATEADMLANAPRIAPAWDDWDPSDPAQGTVRLSDAGGLVEIEWHNVRLVGASCGGPSDSNTFCATLDLVSGKISFGYGGMLLCRPAAPAVAQVVGITPGGGTSVLNNLDLSSAAIPLLGSAGLAMYEDFALSSLPGPPPTPGFDLAHLTSIQGLQLAFNPVPTGGYDVSFE